MDIPATKGFHVNSPWTLYGPSGDVMAAGNIHLKKKKRFSLNFYAPPMAVKKARDAHGESTKVFFTFRDQRHVQHVYYGTVRDASNAKAGYPAVKGVINLTTWMNEMKKKGQQNPASSAPPLKRALTHIDKAMSVVGSELLTQGEHHQGAVKTLLEKARVEAAGLATMEEAKVEEESL